MAGLSPQAETVISAFSTQPGVTREQADNLRAIVNASPALVDQFNTAVERQYLKQIVPLTNPNAGGEYEPQTQSMRIPLARLTALPGGRLPAAGELTFVLGHELQHGFNAADTAQAREAFHDAVKHITRHQSEPRDYTEPLNTLLSQHRRDEAGAEIAGWNAVVSRVKAVNPHPSLQDIYREQPGRMADFIEVKSGPRGLSYELKQNLSINSDLTLSSTPGNLEAMGQNYFDKLPRSPGGLGALGNSDYPNYYAANAISFIAQAERASHPPQPGNDTPQIALNLSRLHLRESLLEENGLDLGRDRRPLPYFDSSTQPPVAGLLQHTADTHRHVSPVANGLPEPSTPPAQGAEGHRSDDPSLPGHPDHALLEQIRAGMRRVDADLGKAYDHDSERLSRSLLAACKDNRDMYPGAAGYSLAGNALERVDHVVLGKTGNLIAVQGALDDPAMKRAVVPVEQALATPVEQSDQKLALANQALGQEQQRTTQPELERHLTAPAR
ncbi:XVIPCD domain-containing protein [uncultured Xanthomonas sp.]|uniref:XVIPCD domain-containing protein n=1 Tax=uncultured Xanthomonas sp. TaxID=152831 RepID=UPI0025FC95B2|nr:XVIPCD domain-containing protein [uncultured Xanthomonas sp.]